jgi:FkbM family methyltransferase
MSRWVSFLATHAPWLGPPVRYLRAARDALLPARGSYSQHGEDAWLADRLTAYDLSASIYVDVGASHPTTISNTYLFYRRGLHGITIEPNLEYLALHRRFRPRDMILAAGCGSRAGAAVLEVSKTPVLSRMRAAGGSLPSMAARNPAVLRHDLVPLLPLDAVLRGVAFDWIFLLSIDAEGLDLDVLRGADETLRRVLFVCVEANGDEERAAIQSHLEGRGFALETAMACNLIFRNRSGELASFAKACAASRAGR